MSNSRSVSRDTIKLASNLENGAVISALMIFCALLMASMVNPWGDDRKSKAKGACLRWRGSLSFKTPW